MVCSLTSRTHPGCPPTAPARSLSHCTHALCRSPRVRRAILRCTSFVPPGSCSAGFRSPPLGNPLSYALETMSDHAHNAVLAGTHQLLATDLDPASGSLSCRECASESGDYVLDLGVSLSLLELARV